MRKAPAARFAFQQQATARLRVAEKLFGLVTVHTNALKWAGNDFFRAVSHGLAGFVHHHVRGERAQHDELLLGAQFVLRAFGLSPPSEQDLTNLCIQFYAAPRQRAVIAMHHRHHRQ